MVQQDKRIDLQSQEAYETESEAEQVLDNKAYQESIKWKFGQLKDAPAVKKKKEAQFWQLVKRLTVGFFVLALYVNTYLVSTLTMALFPYYLLIMAQYELISLNRNLTKDRVSGCYKREWAIILCGHFLLVPSGLLDKTLLENSGVRLEDYPIVYAIFVEYFRPLTLASFSLVFVWVVSSLKSRTAKYQISKFGFALVITMMGMSAGWMHSKVAVTAGRWWYAFPFLTTAWNDSCAYFCGMSLGRHKLIGLSPNKTLEGFIGALVCNVLTTLYVADMVLSGSQFWTCAPKRFTMPFEDYQCETLPKIYQTQSYQMPFTFMGLDELKISPALLYCCVYCCFSALIAPFAGFFASGMKRAYQIKDFADTLPGHGGFVDRFDCHLLTVLFNYFMISQVIFKDEYQADAIYDMSRSLANDERINLVNMLAASQGLPPV